MPFFAVAIGWMAANHVVNGRLVEWKIVPAVSEVCFLQRVAPTDRLARRKAVPATATARTGETVAPAQPGQGDPALLPGPERLAERRVAQTPNPIAVTSFIPNTKGTCHPEGRLSSR